MRAKFVLLFCLVSLAFACSKGQDKEEPQGDPEAEVIFKMVSSAMNAGFLSHDLDAYMAVWSEDAVLIGGRSAEPRDTDIKLSRQQIEDTKRLRFAGKAGTMDATIPEHKVTVAGKEAILEWRMVFKAEGYLEEAKEIFKLTKTPEGWRVYENRYWVVVSGTPAQPIQVDAALWEKRDLAVEKATQSGPAWDKVHALQDAMRWREAHSTLTDLTINEPKNAALWSSRAQAALMIGNVTDAKLAACKARALDPKQGMPQWAMLLPCAPQPAEASDTGKAAKDAGAEASDTDEAAKEGAEAQDAGAAATPVDDN